MNQNKSNIIYKNDSALLRKFFLAGTAISIIAGLIIIAGQRLRWYNQEAGTILGVIAVIIIFSIMLALFANFLKKKSIAKEPEFATSTKELSANEIIYHSLIENSGVVMYTTSVDGYISFTSSKALELTGYSPEELVGMHFTQLLDADWMDEVIGKYTSQLKNNLEETLIEFCIRTKYGDLKWVEQSAILISENNIPTGFQCIVKEISKRKEMEEVLRKYEMELVQNQDRLQSILDNATSLMYIKDLEGRYLVINKQFKESLHVNDNSVIGKTDFDFASAQQAQRYKDTDDEVIKTCKPVQLEDVIAMADGAHHLLIVKFPLLDAQNKIYGIGGIATDITERVHYEEQLIQAKKIAEDAKRMQEQFLANMSHEIRTPMNGIQGMTDLLSETNLNNEQKDFVLTIKRSSDNLLVIINDILDFSKIQAGKLTLEKIDFKLIEVVENIKAIFKSRIQEKRVFFNFDIDKNIPVILNGDPYRLNQILINLIGNSIKFTHTGGVAINISIQHKTQEEMILEFTIKDTGIGIEDDKIDEIFESFTQASIETSRKYGGTGLGLAITKQLLEMQNGHISVESKIGVGTTFKFSIPYCYSQADNSVLFTSKDVKNYTSLFMGRKFLIAEDNEVNQKVIRHVLQKAGGVVDMANNGYEAISFLKKTNDYCLIIMDLQMPEMDGYAATKYIRTEMKLSIPIIAMTASALKGEKTRCLEIGMNDYLSKPFEFRYLYKRIAELLNEIPPVKIPYMTNEKNTEEKLFNLSILREMDDNDYLTDIISIFLKNTPADLQVLKRACGSKDFPAIHKIAHKLKGSAGILQANGLLKLFVKLEEFAKAENSQGIMVLAEQAGEEYKRIEKPLKESVKNLGTSHSIAD